MIDGELKAASIAVLVLLGVGIAGQYYFAGSLSQPFSEIGILTSSGRLGPYPHDLVVGTNTTLDLYVANYEGHSMMYTVYEKLGTRSSLINQTVPLASDPVATYWFVLPNNDSITQPITVNLQSPGNETRIVWELWDFVPSSNSWVYDGSWAQLYVNATAPP